MITKWCYPAANKPTRIEVIDRNYRHVELDVRLELKSAGELLDKFTWFAEGLRGTIYTTARDTKRVDSIALWCSVQSAYERDERDGKADTYNICLLSEDHCKRGLVPPIDCSDCPLVALDD